MDAIMSSASLQEIQTDLPAFLKRTTENHERIIVQENGKEVAALVPLQDIQALEEIEDRLDLEDALASLAEARNGNTTSWEAVKKELNF